MVEAVEEAGDVVVLVALKTLVVEAEVVVEAAVVMAVEAVVEMVVGEPPSMANAEEEAAGVVRAVETKATPVVSGDASVALDAVSLIAVVVVECLTVDVVASSGDVEASTVDVEASIVDAEVAVAVVDSRVVGLLRNPSSRKLS